MSDYIDKYRETLKEMTLEQLLAEWAIMGNAAARDWRSGDIQGYTPHQRKSEAVRAHIIANFRHRGGESLAEIREWYKAHQGGEA